MNDFQDEYNEVIGVFMQTLSIFKINIQAIFLKTYSENNL